MKREAITSKAIPLGGGQISLLKYPSYSLICHGRPLRKVSRWEIGVDSAIFRCEECGREEEVDVCRACGDLTNWGQCSHCGFHNDYYCATCWTNSSYMVTGYNCDHPSHVR